MSPRETETPPSADTSWFGHPRQLARLFTTEMWERFGYYGMRALLTLYLVKHFAFSDQVANGLYGAFTSLVYLTPLFGGLLADQYLGYKRSVKFGALLMAVGYFALCFGGDMARPYLEYEGKKFDLTITKETIDGKTESFKYVELDGTRYKIDGLQEGALKLTSPAGVPPRLLPTGTYKFEGRRDPFWVYMTFLALSCVIVGNGFFKPNISTIVGSLYPPGDPRRDSGFTIFYMGVNIGSTISQFLCPLLAERFGFWAGFLLAALGMLCAWFLFHFDGGRLAGYGEPPATNPRNIMWILIGSIAAIPVVLFLLHNTMISGQAAATAAAEHSGIIGYLAALPILGKVLFAVFLGVVIGIPIWSFLAGTREEAEKMVVAIVLVVFSVVFWTLFEQAGSSMTLFADRSTERQIGNYLMPAGQTQIFNPLVIVIFAPLMSMLWIALAKRGLEPSIPVKFAIGLLLVGIGFLTLVYAGRFASDAFKVGLFWLALAYWFHSIGELCLSPVGLSMITKLSIPRVVGLMMGVWYLSSSMAQYVGGIVAQFASTETVAGEVTDSKAALETSTQVFNYIGWAGVASGVVLLVLAIPLKRMMHGVK